MKKVVPWRAQGEIIAPYYPEDKVGLGKLFMSEIDKAERIAKILAKATSNTHSEAEISINSAIKRMRRDGVDFEDLINLDRRYLYQDTLVTLAGQLTKINDRLSEGTKRDLYNKYFSLIYNKFNDFSEHPQDRQKQQQWSSEKEAQARARQQEADQKRRQREELERRAKAEEEERRRQCREEKERKRRIEEKIANAIEEDKKKIQKRKILMLITIASLVVTLLVGFKITFSTIGYGDISLKNSIISKAWPETTRTTPPSENGVNPSFDCKKSQYFAEKIICENPELTMLDNELSAQYKIAKINSDDMKSLSRGQLIWLKHRNQCETEDCVRDAYKKRIIDLEKISKFSSR